jgi:hypothetical protein
MLFAVSPCKADYTLFCYVHTQQVFPAEYSLPYILSQLNHISNKHVKNISIIIFVSIRSPGSEDQTLDLLDFLDIDVPPEKD